MLFGILVIFLLLTGCSIGLNTKTKEVRVSTGVFGGDIDKMRQSIADLQYGIGRMQKDDVRKTGWDFSRNNVDCRRGPEAMPLIVGVTQNTVDLSTAEKIESYAKAVNEYEACKFIELKIKSEKDRWFWSKNKGKTKGPENSFVIVFKNGILFSAKETNTKHRNETEVEKSFGGNVLETIINTGISAGRKF